jgi:hypothetical protein
MNLQSDYTRLPIVPPTPTELIFEAETGRNQDQVDDIENITIQIFAGLHSLADRIKRSEIVDATKPSNVKLLESYVASTHSRRFNPLRKETNFYEQEDTEQKIRTKHVVSNILFTLGSIFFGLEFFDSHQDSRTNDEMKQKTTIDKTVWTSFLKNHYKDELNVTMNQAFTKADELLKNRQVYAKKAYYYRLTLYATLTLSLVGKVMKQKVFTILGLAASLITLIFMLILYGTNSLKQARLGADLKKLVEIAEKNAARYRLLCSNREAVTNAN